MELLLPLLIAIVIGILAQAVGIDTRDADADTRSRQLAW
jgi:hypothetical protein